MAAKSIRTELAPVESSEVALSLDILTLIGKAENIELAAVAMQAVSHPVPIKSLRLLSSGKMMAQEITVAVDSTQSNISQHLGILRACGMINLRKDAKNAFYRIEDARILKMVSLTRAISCRV
jgi:ArsR family transcriptional regulator